MGTVVDFRDRIVSTLAEKLGQKVASVEPFRGAMNLRRLMDESAQTPALFVSNLGGPSEREVHATHTDWRWSVYIATADNAERGVGGRDDVAVLLAESVADIVHTNPWGDDALSKPMRVRTRNLDSSGALDREGLALWVVAWDQKAETDLPGLADAFETLVTNYDRVGDVGNDVTTLAQDQTELEQ